MSPAQYSTSGRVVLYRAYGDSAASTARMGDRVTFNLYVPLVIECEETAQPLESLPHVHGFPP